MWASFVWLAGTLDGTSSLVFDAVVFIASGGYIKTYSVKHIFSATFVVSLFITYYALFLIL